MNLDSVSLPYDIIWFWNLYFYIHVCLGLIQPTSHPCGALPVTVDMFVVSASEPPKPQGIPHESWKPAMLTVGRTDDLTTSPYDENWFCSTKKSI